jgi:hypothetical protein
VATAKGCSSPFIRAMQSITSSMSPFMLPCS